MTEALADVIERLEATIGTDRDPAGRAFAPISELLRGEGRLVEARVRVEAGIEANPDFSSGHIVAARIYADLGLDELARTAVDRVLGLDPANEEASALATALESAEEELALEWARAQGQAPVAEPADDELLTATMGELYLRQGAPSRAVALFERMIANDPENETLRSRLEEARLALDAKGLQAVEAGAPADLGSGQQSAPERLPGPPSEPRPGATEESELELANTAALESPVIVAIQSLAPSHAGPHTSPDAPVAVTDLGPEVVSVHTLAPDVVGVESLAPDGRTAAEGAAREVVAQQVADGATDGVSDEGPEADVDDFMAWLDNQ